MLLDNKLVCNIPRNIAESQLNNTFIGNEDIPCAPCEIPPHMRPHQKIVLDIHRKHLLVFEEELTKLKNAKNM